MVYIQTLVKPFSAKNRIAGMMNFFCLNRASFTTGASVFRSRMRNRTRNTMNTMARIRMGVEAQPTWLARVGMTSSAPTEKNRATEPGISNLTRI